jgi:glycosyltransferase involved in cell wall biosynthesis
MLSIITPVYNGKRFIEACIQNVIDQASPSVEHIIVDAGSTDGTIDVIKRYANEYKHIRWISEPDKGQSDAMNKGLSMAKNEIVSFLNVDDFYESDALKRIISIWQNFPAPTLLIGNCRILGDADRLVSVNSPKKLDVFSLVSLKAAFPLNPSAYFYHKSLHQEIGPYPIDEHYLMDLDFILKAIPVSNVVYRDEIWGNHRQIEATKTVNFIESGEHSKAVKKLLSSHARKVLPLHQQMLVALEVEVFYRFRYFTKHPREISVSIRKKLGRRLLDVTG